MEGRVGSKKIKVRVEWGSRCGRSREDRGSWGGKRVVREVMRSEGG